MQTTFIINRAYVFLEFNKAGTTSNLKFFYSEIKQKTEMKRELSEESVNELNKLFRNIKYKKHKQKKIAGIEKGIEVCDTNGCYCLILTPIMLIDISRGYEFELSAEEYRKICEIIEL